MTCNNKCIHYPVCEQKNYDFANIEECPYYYDTTTVEPICKVTFDKEQLQEIVDKAKAELLASIERPNGKWIITAEDSEGIHRIQCPFCGYEKGSDFIDYITVTFEKLPPFCESCGAELKGGEV